MMLKNIMSFGNQLHHASFEHLPASRSCPRTARPLTCSRAACWRPQHPRSPESAASPWLRTLKRKAPHSAGKGAACVKSVSVWGICGCVNQRYTGGKLRKEEREKKSEKKVDKFGFYPGTTCFLTLWPSIGGKNPCPELAGSSSSSLKEHPWVVGKSIGYTQFCRLH